VTAGCGGAQMATHDHPDVLEFVHATDTAGELANFNVSGPPMTMQRLVDDGDFELAQGAPSPRLQTPDVYQRDDGHRVTAVKA
jgi:hypothetical protein